MICFKCKIVKNNIEEFKHHLRDGHRLKQHDLYKCEFEKCHQEFNNSSSFYRHLKIKHKCSEELQLNEQHEETSLDFLTLEDNEFSKNKTLSVDSDKEEIFNTIDNEQCYDENEFENIFFHFLTSLHSKPSLTKKTIQEIFATVKNTIIDPILNYVNNPVLRRKIGKSYSKYDSYHKYQKRAEEKGISYKPEQETISQKITPIFKNGQIVYDIVKEKVTLMPIKQQIKVFLELPNVLDFIIKYMNELNNEENVSNFIQCEKWKKIRSEYKSEDTVIPCFLYHDDFEPDNPLGSNAGNNKIAAFYYSFPVIPLHLLSSPNYIFDALFFSSHLKYEDLHSCLLPLINIFIDLETNGIVLNIEKNEKKVYIVLCVVLGDNLAINEMLGLSKSFNANNFCRFCTLSKDESKQTVKECEKSLRKIETYDNDLEKNENGVISECCFRKLKFFHPYTNFEIDIMHDLYEGVARYDLALILHNFIYDKKYFNLNVLNEIKQKFEYGQIEIGNLGKELSETQLKKGYIVMSASEMKTFLELIPLMIAHLVPEKNAVWALLLQLCSLSNQLFKTNFTKNDIDELEKNITLYLERRIRIFGKTLKPKHHFLTHASRCIKNSGPLKFLSCFAYEQRNRITKHYSKVCFQRKNLSWSLSYKSATSFNKYLKYNENGFPPEILYEEKHKKSLSFADFSKQIYISQEILDEVDREKPFYKFSVIQYKSTFFKIGFYIALDNEYNEIDCFKIIDFLLNGIDYYIIAQKQFIEFDIHSQSYLLQGSSKIHRLISFEKLNYFPFNMHSNINGMTFFRLKSL